MWKAATFVAIVTAAGAVSWALVGTMVERAHEQNAARRIAETRPTGPVLQPVEINHPDGPPTVKAMVEGQMVDVSCATCHATRAANLQARSGDDLTQFHQGLKMKHGTLACISCHNARDYTTLRLAEGRAVGFSEVMSLCAQCHGPQFRDYEHGAHGGRSGYWDRRRGPQQRNNCIDCHDPHAPAYAGVRPAAGPRDRFLTPAATADQKGAAHE